MKWIIKWWIQLVIILLPEDVYVGCRESHASDFNDGNEDAKRKIDRIDDWYDFFVIEMIQHCKAANSVDRVVGFSLMIGALNVNVGFNALKIFSYTSNKSSQWQPSSTSPNFLTQQDLGIEVNSWLLWVCQTK